jgi:prepilin-type processing-associated H-X9-DG protein
VPYGTSLPGTMGGRRVHAWADPDTVANGYSGPSNSAGSRLAKINNNKTPIGGPAECLWSINNCGPNDEPFGFHPGGVNSTFGDGSVRYLSDDIDGVVVKWMVGSADGQNVNID